MADGKVIFETLLDESGLLKGLDDVNSSAGNKLNVIGSAFEKTGGIMTKSFTAPILGAGTAFIGTAEATREYRTEMGKLEAAFTTAGHTTDAAKKTYEDLFAVLGEEDTSVEAANHLAKLTDNEKDLNTWTDICTGVFATFGDSLPIEGLTEAANETAKVGQVTGPLADALNWAGVSEDEFNQKLAACSTEQERQALITKTLNGLYGEASDNYKKVNGDVMEANRAQAKLTDSLARIGAIAEPIMTTLKDKAADLLNGVAGLLETFANAPSGIQALVLGFVAVLVAIGPLLVIFGKVTTGLGNIMDFSSRVRTSLLKKTAATVADTAASTANAAANNAAGKAHKGLSKVLTAGKFLLIGAAIAGVVALLLAFAKDGDAATLMVQNFALKVQEMIGKFAEMIPTILSAITTALPVILQAGVNILLSIINGITSALPSLMAAVPNILLTIVNTIISNLPTLITAALQIITTLAQGIISAIPQIAAAIPKIIIALVNAITENLPTIISAALQIIVALAGGLIGAIPTLVKSLPQIITAIARGLLTLLGEIGNVGISILKKLWNGISSWVTTLKEKIVNLAESLPEKFKEGLGSLVDIGKNLVKGLWNGIKSVKDWVLDKIKGFGDAILDGIKSFFGIHSPSLVMDKIIGKNIALGIAQGIAKNTKTVVKNAEDQMAAIQDAYSDVSITSDFGTPAVQTYAARFARADNTAQERQRQPQPNIEQTINIYQPVATPAETARAIKRQATFGLAGV
ncbi:hypothetical protein OBO34_21305 [Clostridiales Family XIII bacterium ASD5510]|uniref:Phage-related protein n=2 Tax=Bacteria TaxID=2 RepID=A0A9J6QZG0_9FIRM|nr:hypothetical protein [Hominibacterium faecale]MCU7380855.1 hypothetical protein [Hominibacterium faecale]